jgi:amidohydrolase
MELTDDFLADLTYVRREYHRLPELSKSETATALTVLSQLSLLNPTNVICGIGGTGIVAEFDSGVAGPSVLFRAELDALLITEINSFPHKSCNDCVSHKCGHDGHMASVMGVARLVASNMPKRGKVYVLFQPAEETGSGAEAMLTDPKMDAIRPDYVFAYHNVPGHPMGQVILRHGAVTASVRSVIIKFFGKTSHAAEPEFGINPATTIAHLVNTFTMLSNNDVFRDDFCVITPVHINVGEVAYGVSAGYGELHLTIRTWTENEMTKLVSTMLTAVEETATANKLRHEVEWVEIFVANENASRAVEMLLESSERSRLPQVFAAHPFKWGEDFGRFTAKYPGAFFCIGAGTDSPALHNPDYDFPDEILSVALKMFTGVLLSPVLNMYDATP